MNTNFNPFVRYIAKSTYIIADKDIIANDCRFIYIISGSGSLESGDKTYPLSPGKLLYYPCGTPYRFTVNPEGELLFYTVNFDFSCRYSDVLPMGPEDYTGQPPGNILYTQSETECEMFESIVYLPSAMWCEDALEKICEEGVQKNEGYRAIQSSLMKILLINVFRSVQDAGNNSLCNRVKDILHQNINLSNKQIAGMLGYHPFYLNELFKKEEGITVHQYVLKKKLAKAHKLITSTQMTIEEISVVCGFSSQSHLSYVFKKSFGVSPNKIRKLL